MELIDVVELTPRLRAACQPTSAAGMTALEQAKRMPGVIVVGGVPLVTASPEEQREVVAALTVTLDPARRTVQSREDPSQGLHRPPCKSEQDSALGSNRRTRVHRISGESQGEGKDPLPMLLIEYLWRSTYGLRDDSASRPRR